MKIHFEHTVAAAHLLPKYEGACQRIHGHNFKIICDITAYIHEINRMVVDFKDLKWFFDEMDHKIILPLMSPSLKIIKIGQKEMASWDDGVRSMTIPIDEVCALPIKKPTCEELSRYFCVKLKKYIEDEYDMDVNKISVKIYENDRNYAEETL